MSTPGQRLSHARSQADLTMDQLAAASTVSVTTICKIEGDKHRKGPHSRTLYKLARALGIEAADLIEDDQRRAARKEAQVAEGIP